jgi:predicted ATPase
VGTDHLHTLLTELESAQLIRRADDPDLAYLFKHTLSQETAYASLLLRKRREVHRRVAQSIERLYADRLDDYAALLARHYAEVGDDAKTLEYATRAGDAAMRIYANAEAVTHYSLALEVAPRVAQHVVDLPQIPRPPGPLGASPLTLRRDRKAF